MCYNFYCVFRTTEDKGFYYAAFSTAEMSNAKQKRRGKKMKNQPASVTYPFDAGPSHNEAYFWNVGERTPQLKKQGIY